jgi:hypothetical protein
VFAIISVVIRLSIATKADLRGLEIMLQLNAASSIIIIPASMFMWAVDNNISNSGLIELQALTKWR